MVHCTWKLTSTVLGETGVAGLEDFTTAAVKTVIENYEWVSFSFGRGEEDEDEESARKNRLGLNKRGGDDDEEGPRGGDLDFDDDDIEKGDDWEHEEIFTDDDEAVGNDPEEREHLAPEIPAPPKIKQGSRNQNSSPRGFEQEDTCSTHCCFISSCCNFVVVIMFLDLLIKILKNLQHEESPTKPRERDSKEKPQKKWETNT
ncbi:hypothetical protein L6452_40376 [Arctium lappa]|uniref:Uncharacterized protein n=1 Tax=Arctium lappa TaxID=4217 RepID=A0ACB8XL51_ARCLA|nr:hypothetical protein L6452_40376 [Arctium lappa]